ncbi:MAG TPA: GlsB/YeaQ/YmgE family stress response membrane protein [Candidatus Limnocylindrales bacterium]|nr:GlsB/YeaQ/YmgE family stress response membrane protein [Candidatus Limnocylindrales bacterium]
MVITIIAWIVLGAIAGWIAGLLVSGDEGLGVIGHVVLGIVGAFVGGFLANLVGFGAGAAGGGDVVNIYSIVVAVIGAVIVVWVASFLMRGRKTAP